MRRLSVLVVSVLFALAGCAGFVPATPELASSPTPSHAKQKPTKATKPAKKKSAKATPTCLIKGNISQNTGERIYHVPGQQYYAVTVIDESAGERWFCTEAQARAAGWRKSKV
jgi:hypothetical protein